MPYIVEVRPVGTLQDLKDAHRDPMAYGCCAEPDPRGGKDAVMGCAAWHKCKWKGVHPKGNVGPANKGTQLLKKGTYGPAMRNAIMPCFDYVPLQANIVLNGGVLDVIAEEGDKIELAGSVKVPADLTKGIPNEYWRDFKPGENMVEVPAYPRLSDQPKLKMAMKMEARRKEIEQHQEDDARRQHLGMNQVILPTEGQGETNPEANIPAVESGGIGHPASPEGAEIHSNLGGTEAGTEGLNPDQRAGRKRPRYGAD